MVPGWYIPSNHLSGKEKANYPRGNFNVGMAHGIAGILSFLAICSLHGIVVNGQMDALRNISEWLQFHQQGNKNLCFWESVVSFDDEGIKKEDQAFSGRDAWCYGTPGVATSLYLAGKALADEALKNYALKCFKGVFERPDQWFLPGPGICHGKSGLLIMTHMMAEQTKDCDLKKQVKILLKDLLKGYRSEFPFGFKDRHPCENSHIEVDQAGLLEGVSGILLILMSVNQSTSWWHAPFLILDGKI